VNEESRPPRRLSSNVSATDSSEGAGRNGRRTAWQDAALKIEDAFQFARTTLSQREFASWLDVVTTKTAHEHSRLLLRERS
jgi:hypothetical protein